MKYEVAVIPSTSAHEMVRDLVVEEMTDTLSPSGEENIDMSEGTTQTHLVFQ